MGEEKSTTILVDIATPKTDGFEKFQTSIESKALETTEETSFFTFGDRGERISIYADEHLARAPFPLEGDARIRVLGPDEPLLIECSWSIERSSISGMTGLCYLDLETQSTPDNLRARLYLESGSKPLAKLRVRGQPDESFYPPKPRYENYLGILAHVETLRASGKRVPNTTQFVERNSSEHYFHHVDVYWDAEFEFQHEPVDFEQKLRQQIKDSKDIKDEEEEEEEDEGEEEEAAHAVSPSQ